MAGLESAIRLLLRPSDSIVCFVECFSAYADGQDTSHSSNNDSTNSRHKRIVVVVTHRDEINGWEEGSVFVLKPKLFSAATIKELEIHRVFPIYGDFTMTMAQMRQETLDLSRLSVNEFRSGFKVTIHPGHTLIGSEPLDLVTYDITGLKNVLAECRRLKELSEIVPEASSPTQTYSWLAFYTANSNVYIPSRSSIFLTFTAPTYPDPVPSSFPDLRDLFKPLYTRLSPASAGTTSDGEINDIVLVRDDWARTRARNQCRKGRARLNLRLGTFNVNGKMPSQDLSAWVRGKTQNQNPLLEPLPVVKDISPLSLGEVVKNRLDADTGQGIQTSFFSYSSVSSKHAIHSGASTFSVAHSAGTASSFTLTNNTMDNTSVTFPSESTASSDLVIPIPVLLEPLEVPTLAVSEKSSFADSEVEPDVLVLGFEELDLSTEALLYSTSTVREDAWTEAIFAALGEKAEMYEKLASKQLVGMLIIVIVKKYLRSCFSDIITISVGAGIMGLMGNKGGTAIRLAFTPPASGLDTLDAALNVGDPDSEKHHHGIENPGPTILTFVVSHLAAFDEMVDKRNADFQDLSKRLMFDSSTMTASASPSVPANNGKKVNVSTASSDDTPMPGGMAVSSSLVTVPEKFGVFETDVLLWMGDLNYRIDLPDADVRTLLQSENWRDQLATLLHYDQLRTAIRHKKAFDIFVEHDIKYLPTYRFSSGISTDALGYDVKRKPAWTDRILHTFSPLTASVNQLSYSGHPEITVSDHRPVSAEFTVDLDFYDKDQLHATAANLLRQVQGMEELQGRAKAKLSHTSIELGNIFYKQKKTTTFTFHNCGKVPLAFRFVPIELHSEPFPEWLSASQTTGLLLPNELIEITLTVYIDNAIASRLNLGSRDIHCTLIMHTMMGQDYFIAISAQYQYTCFANKLSRLTRLPGPIRKIHSANDLLDADRALSAPREVMRLVNWLMACAHPTEDLFIGAVDSEIVDDIREHLDTGDEFPYSHDTRERSITLAFGGALTDLLKSLPEHIVPTDLHERCMAVANRDEAFEILEYFPPEVVNVWISVTAFLHYTVQNSTNPDDKADRLAATFAPILFGFLRNDYPTISTTAASVSPLRYQQFIKSFIHTPTLL